MLTCVIGYLFRTQLLSGSLFVVWRRRLLAVILGDERLQNTTYSTILRSLMFALT